MSRKADLLRAQLKILKPIITNTTNIKQTRKLQDEAGRIMAGRRIKFITCTFHDFEACISYPKNREQPSKTAILYLHGGGYTAGTLEYAKGFGSKLAQMTGLDTMCVGYRLAPEHPYPAAIDDAFAAYGYLRLKYEKIIFCGESAGGGLCYALCLKLKDERLPLPECIVALSPWTDLTQSGDSYITNRDVDPILDEDNLRFSANAYAGNTPLDTPYVSPLFGDLSGLPESLLFAGGDEILLSDSQMIYDKLISSGCEVHFKITPDMWHVYPLYGIDEADEDLRSIADFIAKWQQE